MKSSHNLSSKYENYFVSSVDYKKTGFKNRVNISFKLLYSFEAKRKMRQLLIDEKPDIAHLHNIHHQISPSILPVLKEFKIPVIMTLHDYKMCCASYLMIANGSICEACKNGKYYQCLLKKCVKDSRSKSLLNTMEMYLHHNILKIYDLVDIFISPSKFQKAKLEEMGFNKKIIHLSNFVKIEDFVPIYNWEGRSISYFGRLSEEKGIGTLINAVKGLDVKLKLFGDGPIKNDFLSRIKNERLANIDLLGYKTGEELKKEIKKSMFFVIPSECYENNPRSVIESFALGKPVVGSRIGGIPELVKDNETGLTFEPGNSEDLRKKIEYLVNNPNKVIEMGKNARAFAERELNAEIHHNKLMKIYEKAIEFKRTGRK